MSGTAALPRTRFAALTRWPALAVLLLTLGLMLASLNFPMPPTVPLPVLVRDARAPGAVISDPNPDLVLYRAINRRMDAGEGYYRAAAAEQRKQGYPLRPFVTFRLPTLALLHHALGRQLMTALLWGLIALVVLAWWVRLDGAFADPGRRVIGFMLVISGVALCWRQELIVLHDNWAGLCVSLSLALHRPGRAWPSMVMALAAVLIREIALPYALLMGAFAVWNRAWREVIGWGLVLVVACGVMVAHYGAVADVVTLADPASQGWAVFGGWPFFVLALRQCTALRGLPVALGAGLVPLAMLGWLAWASQAGLRGLLLIIGYVLIMMAAGRPENFYWGLLVAPAFLLGLAFIPPALADLWRAVRAAPA